MVSCSFAALAFTAATLALHVDAHSYMIDPMPTWPVSWATNNFAATIAGQTYLPCPDGMSYSTAPELNTEAYWTAFNESAYTSLKDLVDKTGELQTLSPFGTATLECGFSLANGTVRDLPSDHIEDSECGSLDMAADDSECASLDMAEDSECGSLDIAENTESDIAYTGSTTGINFDSIPGTATVGTVTPQA
ncbi:hypothetical protein PRNP1_013008 [Phytophthora ramorum]